MEDLKTFIDRRTEELMKNLGFTLQTPQKVQKENTPFTGTITFLKHSNRADCQKKKEEK